MNNEWELGWLGKCGKLKKFQRKRSICLHQNDVMVFIRFKDRCLPFVFLRLFFARVLRRLLPPILQQPLHLITHPHREYNSAIPGMDNVRTSRKWSMGWGERMGGVRRRGTCWCWGCEVEWRIPFRLCHRFYRKALIIFFLYGPYGICNCLLRTASFVQLGLQLFVLFVFYSVSVTNCKS